jgi:hypothetical protein
MTTLVGGLRVRMIRESLYQMLHDSLDQLGWFNTNRKHAPINFPSDPADRDEQIPLNTLSVSVEDMTDRETGLGELEVEEEVTYYVDFYAENDAIGLEMIHDIRDILAGRHLAAGRSRPQFDVYDYRQATPPVVGVAQIEDIFTDKARDFPKPWLKHWHACHFKVIDTYGPAEN